MKRIALLIIFFCLTAFACNSANRPPENLIEEEKYIDLLVELQLLESYQQQAIVDSTTLDSLIQNVFKHYETTEKQFLKSHEFYQSNIDKQQNRIDEAIEKLRKDRISGPDSLTTDSAQALID